MADAKLDLSLDDLIKQTTSKTRPGPAGRGGRGAGAGGKSPGRGGQQLGVNKGGRGGGGVIKKGNQQQQQHQQQHRVSSGCASRLCARGRGRGVFRCACRCWAAALPITSMRPELASYGAASHRTKHTNTNRALSRSSRAGASSLAAVGGSRAGEAAAWRAAAAAAAAAAA